MFLLLIAATIFYAAMGLIFFIFSISEMIENGKGSSAKIVFAAAYSAFWPVTLVTVSVTVFVMRSFRRLVAAAG